MGTLTDYASMLTVILTLLSYSHSCDSNEHITYSMSMCLLYICKVNTMHGQKNIKSYVCVYRGEFDSLCLILPCCQYLRRYSL